MERSGQPYGFRRSRGDGIVSATAKIRYTAVDNGPVDHRSVEGAPVCGENSIRVARGSTGTPEGGILPSPVSEISR